MSKAKGEAATEDQLLEMIDFIRNTPVLISNKPSMKERELWKTSWEELCEILNDKEGPIKTVASWQKEWNLLKNFTKEKVKNMETAAQVRSPLKYKLTHIEEKVAQLLREDDDAMDTTSIPEESTSRRTPKRQNSIPSANVSSVSVKSPTPAKRSRPVAQPSSFDGSNVTGEEFLETVANQIEKQNEEFLKMAEAAAQIENAAEQTKSAAAQINNSCKVMIANNVKLLKLIESKFK